MLKIRGDKNININLDLTNSANASLLFLQQLGENIFSIEKTPSSSTGVGKCFIGSSLSKIEIERKKGRNEAYIF